MQKETNFLLRAVRFCIFALLFSPLLFWREFVYYYSSTKVHFVLLISELAVFFFIWLIWKYPQYRPKFSSIGKALLVYFGIFLLSSLAGVDPFFSFWSDFSRASGGLMWFHLVAIFIVITSIFKTQKDWFRVLFVSSIVALLVTVVHFLSNFELDFFVNARSGSTLGNSTFFGTYLLFHIFFSIYLFTQAHIRSLRYYAVCSFIIFVIALFSIDANASQISFFGGIALFLALWLISLGKTQLQRTGGYIVLVSLLIGFISIVLLLFQSESVVHRFFIEQSSESRFVIWDIAWQGIKERPWLGWGPENFEFVTTKYFNPCLGSIACGGEIWFDRAHSTIFDTAVNSGLIGLSAYLALFITAVIHVWKRVLKDKQKNAIPAIFVTILVVYFVQSLTSVDNVVSLLFFVVLLSAMSSVNHPTFFNNESVPSISGKAISVFVPLLLTVVLAITFLFFVIQPIQANRSTLQATASQSMEQHLEDYSRALTGSAMGIDSRRAYLANDTAKFLWMSPRASVKSVAAYAHEEMLMAENALWDTINRPHEDLRSYIYLGKLYQVEGRLFDETAFKKAEEVFKKAIQLSPNHQLPKWLLAGVYLEQGKAAEAVELTREALDLDRHVMRSHKLHVIALKMKGDEQGLVQAVDDLLETQRSVSLEHFANTILQLENISENKEVLLFEFVQ